MAFLSWRKDYEVGVAQIDTEHRSLFDLVNEFHETHARGDTRKEVSRVLNQLVAYTEVHFRHEEQLMSDNDYPQLDQHRELHAALVISIFGINERLAADPVRASSETLKFVKGWLNHHILREDMAIADFLLRKANQAGKARQEAPAEDLQEKPSPEPVEERSSDDE